MKLNNIIKLAVSIAICQLAGIIGSFFTVPSLQTWYSGLEKPFFNPPNWIFGPVWITLFLLMGISAYLILRKGLGDKRIKIALLIFGAQLVLNSFWTILFFGMRSPLYAFMEIIILWAVILLNITSFYKISKLAGLILLPYIFWVSFAAILNFYILILN